MPRPHAPGEPLPVTRDILGWAGDALTWSRGSIRRLSDGRTVTPDTEGDPTWVGADLACLCSVGEEPCADQLIAALLHDWPLAPASDVRPAELDRLRHRLREAATDVVHEPVEHGPRDGDGGWQGYFTDPRRSEDDLLARLADDPRDATILLGLAAARRAGPLRSALWAQLTRPAPAIGLLHRLVETEPDATLPDRVADLTPHVLAWLASATYLAPAMGERLMRVLPAPQRAALLAAAGEREVRLALLRAAAPRPPSR